MSTMDEASWEGRSFQLPIKRSRPITPIEENQDFGGWTNGVNITFNDMGYDYEITRELSASWASAPQMEKFKPAGSDGAKTRPQMRTGCIPCLYVEMIRAINSFLLILAADLKAYLAIRKTETAKRPSRRTGT